MKTKARWLTAGIVLTYVLMCLPWALKTIWFGGYVTYHWFIYPFGMFMGDMLSSISALLAFAALIASLFSAFGKFHRPIVCGILLLGSAVVEIAMGVAFGFNSFTILTYLIVVALTGLWLFALFGFRRKGQIDEAA